MANILIIDGERLLCDLLQEMLQRHGHEVFTAYGGREGVALHKAHRPRFTILDLHLPDNDGIDTLRSIRGNDPGAVVMTLSDASDRLAREAQELGVTDFLTKRHSREAVLNAVTRTVQSQAAVKAGQPLTDKRQGASILVVDDEVEVCKLLEEFLTLRGFRVQSARDGRTALALALAVDERPHLVVLDIMMPGMDGIEVLRRLRANRYAGGVMMLTASTDGTLLKQSLDLEAVDILSKPIDLERLALAIQVGLILNRRARDAGKCHQMRRSASV